MADSDMPEKAEPERIGRYQLCFELASGGMATVYLARADGVSGFEKLVALKRIHRHLAKERDYVEMFLDEARIASRITHSNVCSVFDFGESSGEYFIAMEYLVGEPLSRVYRRVASNTDLRNSPALPQIMARIIADSAEGLHAAHELKDANGELLNVVHRDVSARNLFVTYDGVVQVVDFGIASARQRVHHTSTGQVKGTFPYMAPEQMTAGIMDRRVDIWALGVVLWELLTLKRLFRRDTDVNTMYAVLSDVIRPPSDYRADVPKELDDIVLTALQRDPAARYQTAREMGQALTQYLARQKTMFGPAELSDWMGQLFPQGEARKRQLMEIARVTHASIPVPHNEEEDEDTQFAQTEDGLDLAARPEVPGPMRAGLLTLMVGAMAMFGVVVMGIKGGAGQGQVATTPPAVEQAPMDPAGSDKPQVDAPPSGIAEKDIQADEGDTSARVDLAVGEPEEVDPEFDFGLEPSPKPKTTRTRSSSRSRKPVVKAPPQPTGPPGIINLVTRGGWAYVYRGSERIGTTPMKVKLPPGKHRLRLEPFGERDRKQFITVNVESNKTKKQTVALE